MNGEGNRAMSLSGLILAAGVGVLVAGGPVQADFAAGLAAYLAGDYQTALEEFLPLAEQGHARAQFYLGRMYDKGEDEVDDVIVYILSLKAQ